ncbi:hypothetical protein PMYN1_Chma236 (chromatophore) [Paulinella micropora]|uniref:DUF3120 domain-containing protein n=1 Tax=Paulinella micropora TaxID=1928728 RepID=A0A1L5YBL8_9EUKA|nr:hypothetical protein PCKR_276 [Paulinella micropora]AQX44831.1 hypothetical protein PFK_276 [Paulinella micropora]BBL86045.1 hypothetical protein PMYN1_Chma236 [Paulinella micropora]
MKDNLNFNEYKNSNLRDVSHLPIAKHLTHDIAILSAIMVTLPVFIQAPWVRLAPLSASLFTMILLISGVIIECRGPDNWRELGVLLVGFSGSWLGGCLFWGWYRLHPIWHLPLEGFALPLAIAGLNSRWQLASFFYLASLGGTAITDAIISIIGLMDLWPIVLSASAEEAPNSLQEAAKITLQPGVIPVILVAAIGLIYLSRILWRRDSHPGWPVAASALATTLVVDSLFLITALVSPQLSGLI